MLRGATWVAIACLLLAACSGGGDSSAEDSRASSSTTTTTFDREAEEQAVIDAYLAQLNAFYAAANPPNPDHPALAETATGALLDEVRANLTELATRGVGVRKGEGTTNNPRVTRLVGTVAAIEDCSTDADVQFRIDTGEILDDSVVYGRLGSRVVKIDGRWMVESKTVTQLEKPCAG